MNDPTNNSIRNRPIFGKLRDKIIDELATRMIVEQMAEGTEGVRLPPSWIAEAEHTKMELLEAIADESEMEERTGYDKTKIR